MFLFQPKLIVLWQYTIQQIQKITTQTTNTENKNKKKRVQPIYAAHVVLKGHQIIDQNEGKENVEHEH
jgi:hypothetical protein